VLGSSFIAILVHCPSLFFAMSSTSNSNSGCACIICTFINPPNLDVCEMCGHQLMSNNSVRQPNPSNSNFGSSSSSSQFELQSPLIRLDCPRCSHPHSTEPNSSGGYLYIDCSRCSAKIEVPPSVKCSNCHTLLHYQRSWTAMRCTKENCGMEVRLPSNLSNLPAATAVLTPSPIHQQVQLQPQPMVVNAQGQLVPLTPQQQFQIQRQQDELFIAQQQHEQRMLQAASDMANSQIRHCHDSIRRLNSCSYCGYYNCRC